ncbi:beta-lactamase [Comamonas testosteroni]|uniref:Beta-lactamase n=1 Tax=Comamonas testosteroni TaxID=285 RepID=A0A0L7N9I1_COMTE|nr:MBL fold metallo-hydrolase [Comamonas testosteroni]KOC30528.1 beta-lactamase [Comamonas testosteroni]KWT66504.1 SoxH-like protein [Comamonas testosteroni]
MTSWAGAALRSFVWAAIAATGAAAAHEAAHEGAHEEAPALNGPVAGPPVAGTPVATSAPVMELQQVAANVFFVQGVSALGSAANRNFISNAGFVITHDSVVVIDALGSPALAEELVQKIRTLTPKPISHVLLTHYHADHIYGLQVFEALGAKIVAHAQAREYINSETAHLRLEASRKDLAPWVDQGTRLVPASQWVAGDSSTLKVGGVDFVLQHMGPSHTPEDTAIFLPQSGVLFIGDVVFRNRIPYVGQADSRHWIAALDELLKLPVKVMVPGHGPASEQPRRDMQLTRDYLHYLREAMGKAAANLDPFDEAYQATDWSRFSAYPLFKEANRMNAYNTFLLMEQEKP